MTNVIIDTRVTTGKFGDNTSSLETSINTNVEEFNRYVNINYEGMKAQGERCGNIMLNLFKGYKTV